MHTRVPQLNEVPKLQYEAFTQDEELAILNSFSYEQKQLLSNFAIDAINAITDLPFDERLPAAFAIGRARLLGQLDIINLIVEFQPSSTQTNQE